MYVRGWKLFLWPPSLCVWWVTAIQNQWAWQQCFPVFCPRPCEFLDLIPSCLELSEIFLLSQLWLNQLESRDLPESGGALYLALVACLDLPPACFHSFWPIQLTCCWWERSSHSLLCASFSLPGVTFFTFLLAPTCVHWPSAPYVQPLVWRPLGFLISSCRLQPVLTLLHNW